MKEYFTPKTTEQYPENRKTTLHVAKRHRGRLVFKRVTEDEVNDPQIQEAWIEGWRLQVYRLHNV